MLRFIKPIERSDTLLGQYVAAGGKPGYLDDNTVPHNSVCPTFAATTLWINNPRWEGVPFILKAGKGKSFLTPTCYVFKNILMIMMKIKIH